MDGIELQNIINNYLNEHNKKTIAEVLSEFGKKEEPGVITKHHTIALQQIINEYVSKQRINLNEEIMKSDGRKQVLGIVSSTEVKYINEYINNLNKEKDNSVKRVV